MQIAFLIAALGVAGVAGAIALRPSPVRVEVARVRRGPMRVTVDAEGKTRAQDRFVVATPVSGRLARIDLHRGDAVRRDEVIARIEPLPMAPLDPRQLRRSEGARGRGRAVETRGRRRRRTCQRRLRTGRARAVASREAHRNRRRLAPGFRARTQRRADLPTANRGRKLPRPRGGFGGRSRKGRDDRRRASRSKRR